MNCLFLIEIFGILRQVSGPNDRPTAEIPFLQLYHMPCSIPT